MNRTHRRTTQHVIPCRLSLVSEPRASVELQWVTESLSHKALKLLSSVRMRRLSACTRPHRGEFHMQFHVLHACKHALPHKLGRDCYKDWNRVLVSVRDHDRERVVCKFQVKGKKRQPSLNPWSWRSVAFTVTLSNFVLWKVGLSKERWFVSNYRSYTSSISICLNSDVL